MEFVVGCAFGDRALDKLDLVGRELRVRNFGG
jgi:hypothetical protein